MNGTVVTEASLILFEQYILQYLVPFTQLTLPSELELNENCPFLEVEALSHKPCPTFLFEVSG